ncbi:MAG: hypothetical protein ABIS45_10365 [Burkholderiales bacterium]
MSEEQPSTEQSSEAPFVEAQAADAQHVKRQPQDPKSRLRELLAIPERDRADEVWDEIINLEIDMAPGNRALPAGDNGGGGGGRQQQGQGHRQQQQGRRPDQAQRPQDPSGGKRQGKRFFQKRKRGPGAPADR